MRTRFFAVMTVLPVLALVALAEVPTAGQAPPAAAQWTGARTPDGQPNIQGVWDAALTGTYSLTNPTTGGGNFNDALSGKVTKNPSRIIDPPDGRVPYQPWAAARQARQQIDLDHPTRPEHVDTQNRCLVGGVPRPFYNTQIQIVQTPGYVVFLSDQYHSQRVIALDGRPHIGQDIKLWMGDSVGRWEGNTLVTDVTNLNGKFRLSMVGDFVSDSVHVVERMTFVDADTMNYQARIDDPRVFTRPWTLAVTLKRGPNYEFYEEACHEGERSAEHMLIDDAGKK